MNNILSIVAVAGIACAAHAQVWNEVGDAGDSLATANITNGVGPLTQIIGTFGLDDADLYCIYIPNPALFRATTVGGTADDTQLFLFNSNGFGVTHNDDSPGGSVLQSTITGQFISGPGHYYLAITKYNRDPSSASGLIWLNSPFGVERAPDGPGSADALASWAGITSASSAPYNIFLEGAEYCIPTPGAFALLGMGGLVASRRRRD